MPQNVRRIRLEMCIRDRREIEASVIRDAVEKLCVSANKTLPEDVEAALRSAAKQETDTLPASVMRDLCDNLDAARELDIPVCQDTGMAVVFAEIGQEVHINGSFEEAVNEGVRRGYLNGLLRCSVVADPIRRGNTGDNTPAVLHVRLVEGEDVYKRQVFETALCRPPA